MITNFKIGPVSFSVSADVDFQWKKDVEIFRECWTSIIKDLHYEIRFVNDFEPIWGNILYQDASMTVMQSNNIEHRIHFLPNTNEPYALTSHIEKNQVRILINAALRPCIKWDRNLIGLFSLEHFCLPYDCFLQHASYIIHNGKAIVFTAPSGTGKSTQADLWQKYEGAEIINGDRTLLIQQNGKWYAGGFPVRGSSEYCKNEIAPLYAIICLEKGSQNCVRKLEGLEAWKRIYSQSFVNKWNPKDCSTIGNLISSLVSEGNIYHYSCTKQKDAVDDLKKCLT